MTWPVYPTPAADAAPQPLSDSARPLAILIVAEHGPAPVIDPRPRHGTPARTDLTARAVRMCNRDRKAAATYLEKHQTLASRIYSGGREQ